MILSNKFVVLVLMLLSVIYQKMQILKYAKAMTLSVLFIGMKFGISH
jgi:hypothetical protein